MWWRPRRCMLVAWLLAVAAVVNGDERSTFRLPLDVVPIHYDLLIHTHLGEQGPDDFSFSGRVDITLKATRTGVREIRLHSKALTVDKSRSRIVNTEEDAAAAPSVVDLAINDTAELITWVLDQPLDPSQRYQLQMEFSAPLNEVLAGYYRSSYKNSVTGETRWMAVTQFEPKDARRAFPCFDEPSFKATFSVSLAHGPSYTAISNMPLVKSEPLPNSDGWTVDQFQRSERMSTYLVAFLVSDLDHIDSATADNSTLFRVWARSNVLEQARYASAVGPAVLFFFEKFYQVPYPLPKQDMVAIPDFEAGAMENWGLITYREGTLLFDSKQSSAKSKYQVTSVIAHELAHQWFGNLVTMKWWSDLWLNEGFATYMATLGVNSVQPEWEVLDSDALNNMLKVFRFDSLKSSHPLSVKIDCANEISQIFDAISYAKGSLLLRMMSHFLGEDVFRSGITNYLRDHRLGNAEQDDLWSALTAEAHRQNALPRDMTIKQVMDTWTLQIGYPVVTVERDYETGAINVSQSRYLSLGRASSKRQEASSTCWLVPLTFTTGREDNFNNTTPSLWMPCSDQGPVTVTLPISVRQEQWIILNLQATALYRVMYDLNNWKLIAEALRDNPYQINRLNRAQLIFDALSFASTGHLPYRTALGLLEYLHMEDDYLPWKAATCELGDIHRLIKRTPSYEPYKEYIRDLLAVSMDRWGNLEMTPDANDLVSASHQSLVVSLACSVEVPSCVEQALHLFRRWMETENPEMNSPIPPGLLSEVVCTALRHGGTDEWNFVWQQYLASNVVSMKNTLLQSLTCSSNKIVLKRLLQSSLQSGTGIRLQDSASVFVGIVKNREGFDLAKEYFFKNIADIHKFYGPNADRLKSYLTSIADYIYTNEELTEFKEFTSRNAEYLKQSTMAVKQALEKIDVNIAWHTHHYKEVASILEELTS